MMATAVFEVNFKGFCRINQPGRVDGHRTQLCGNCTAVPIRPTNCTAEVLFRYDGRSCSIIYNIECISST